MSQASDTALQPGQQGEIFLKKKKKKRKTKTIVYQISKDIIHKIYKNEIIIINFNKAFMYYNSL